jgi:DNA-binding NtrC family response regulator
MEERILIVDDDDLVIADLTRLLGEWGYEISSAADGAAALEVVRNEPMALTLLDLKLGGESGLDVLPKLKERRPEMSVIILTGAGTIESAVEAMRRGADNFVVKEAGSAELAASIEKGIEAYRLRRQNVRLKRLTTRPPSDMICESPAMKEVLQSVEMVAQRDVPVLLCGETGTGKQLVAQRIHELSLRKEQPFVEINCAALPRDLVEAGLFGHDKGAFTSAVGNIGLFEAADGGTLFLDEIGEMELPNQAKLLKVIDTQKLLRIGGRKEINVDVRLITATHRSLEEWVAEGRFREDLFYRVNVVQIEVPSLRQRREEILPLARHFLATEKACSPKGSTQNFSSAVEELLLNYHWPGNIRELRNAVIRACTFCPVGSEILPAHLPRDVFATTVSLTDPDPPHPTLPRFNEIVPLAQARGEFERHYLEHALDVCEGNVTEAAKRLGIDRRRLHEKMREYGLASKGQLSREPVRFSG